MAVMTRTIQWKYFSPLQSSRLSRILASMELCRPLMKYLIADDLHSPFHEYLGPFTIILTVSH